MKPTWLSLLVFVLVFAFVAYMLIGLLVGISKNNGWELGPLPTILGLLGTLALSGVLFMAVASVVGSVFWDRLTRETETRVTGQSLADPPMSAQISDTLKRLVFSIGMALLSLCLGFVIPVAGPVAIAGYTATVDATGGSFLRRRIGLGAQLGRVLRLPGAFTFVVIAGVLSVVPLLNVFTLPLTMTAGALMAANGLGGNPLDKMSGNRDTI